MCISMLMRKWMLTGLAIMMTMGVGSAFFEDRAYCAIVDGQVRVSLDESQGRLCRDYRNDVANAKNKLDIAIQQVRNHAENAITEDDVGYWLDILVIYQNQYDALLAFDDSLVQAVEDFDSLVLVRVKRHVNEYLELESLRCTNVWPTFHVRYTSTHYPLCWMGQKDRIESLMSATDLDEYVVDLQAYIEKRTRVLAFHLYK